MSCSMTRLVILLLACLLHACEGRRIQSLSDVYSRTYEEEVDSSDGEQAESIDAMGIVDSLSVSDWEEPMEPIDAFSESNLEEVTNWHPESVEEEESEGDNSHLRDSLATMLLASFPMDQFHMSQPAHVRSVDFQTQSQVPSAQHRTGSLFPPTGGLGTSELLAQSDTLGVGDLGLGNLGLGDLGLGNLEAKKAEVATADKLTKGGAANEAKAKIAGDKAAKATAAAEAKAAKEAAAKEAAAKKAEAKAAKDAAAAQAKAAAAEAKAAKEAATKEAAAKKAEEKAAKGAAAKQAAADAKAAKEAAAKEIAAKKAEAKAAKAR